MACTVWVTGLPAAGKTTLTARVHARLDAMGIAVSMLDGDELRRNVNHDLGFDAVDRAESVRRAAEMARALCATGTFALVSLVSPYVRDRQIAREIHERAGIWFFEVHVATPLGECERRDPKGLYARARRGELGHMTGVDDPYEAPENPDLKIGATDESIDSQVDQVIGLMRAKRLLGECDGQQARPLTARAI